MEEIVTKVYRDFTINRMQLMGYALQNIKILPAFRTGYIVLTKDILEAYGYKIEMRRVCELPFGHRRNTGLGFLSAEGRPY